MPRRPRQFLAKGALDRRSETFEALQKLFYGDILARYANEDRSHTGDFDVKAKGAGARAPPQGRHPQQAVEPGAADMRAAGVDTATPQS